MDHSISVEQTEKYLHRTTVTFSIFNIIIFHFDGLQPHHPPFILIIRVLLLIHCSLFICHVKFDHCRRHLFFPLNVFYLVQTWFQSCTPECTNSLAFFPVRTLHPIQNRFHQAPNHQQSEVTELDLADNLGAYYPQPLVRCD